jgi:hypothetical protein
VPNGTEKSASDAPLEPPSTISADASHSIPNAKSTTKSTPSAKPATRDMLWITLTTVSSLLLNKSKTHCVQNGAKVFV